MFKVADDFSITITRGDTAALEVQFTGDAPGNDDLVVASVKKSVGNTQTFIRKILQNTGENAFTFVLESADTQNMDYGRYAWDLRIIYEDGAILTPFANRPFVVSEVVTDITTEGG